MSPARPSAPATRTLVSSTVPLSESMVMSSADESAQDPDDGTERDGSARAATCRRWPRPRSSPRRWRRQAEVADDERALRLRAVDDRAAFHLQVADDQRLIERAGRLAGRARPHLEDRPVDLDGAEGERLSPQEPGGDHEPRAGGAEAIRRPFDHEVVDLAAQASRDDVHPADAAARSERALDAPLDVAPHGVLGKVAERDQDQGQDEEGERGLEDGAGALRHAARRPVPPLTLSG